MIYEPVRWVCKVDGVKWINQDRWCCLTNLRLDISIFSRSDICMYLPFDLTLRADVTLSRSSDGYGLVEGSA